MAVDPWALDGRRANALGRDRDARTGQWLPGARTVPDAHSYSLEPAIRACIGEHGEHAVAILWAIAQGKPISVPGTVDANGAVDLDRVPSLELQAATLRWLYERVFGRVRATVDVHTTSTVQPLDLRRLSDTDLLTFRELARKARDSG